MKIVYTNCNGLFICILYSRAELQIDFVEGFAVPLNAIALFF